MLRRDFGTSKLDLPKICTIQRDKRKIKVYLVLRMLSSGLLIQIILQVNKIIYIL